MARSKSRSTAAKKKTAKTRSKAAGIPLRERWQNLRDRIDPAAWRRAAVVLLWLAAGVAGMLGWIFGVPRLEARVSDAVAPHSPPHVTFADPPKWLQGELQAMLVDTVHRSLDDDPLSSHDLALARANVMATGCFAEVTQVRQVTVDEIRVEGEFLAPYAVVRFNSKDRMIDPQGRLLPGGYRPGEGTHFIAIIGLAFAPPAQPGELWEGADITAALRLLRLINREEWQHQVRSLDMTNFVRGEPIRMITDNGARIVWGAAPDEERNVEVSATEKLQRLQFFYQQYGRIDVGHTGEMDLTDPPAVFVR